MAVVLQVDFGMKGPFGQEMAAQLKGLAESINEEPGFLWKIWTESPETQEAGGIYLFEDQASAQAYLTMHTERLAELGVGDVRGKIFQINRPLTEINNRFLTIPQ